jgi:hypothetical protein
VKVFDTQVCRQDLWYAADCLLVQRCKKARSGCARCKLVSHILLCALKQRRNGEKMKFLKKLGILFLILFSLFCGFVILCAFRPDVTKSVADFLYSDKETEAFGEVSPDGKTQFGTIYAIESDAGNGGEAESDIGSGDETDEAPDGDFNLPAGQEGLAEDINRDYIPPRESELSVPENVAGKNGYQEVQDEREQVEDEVAELLQTQLGVGNTGDGLTFDALWYPYYAMLDEKGKHVYRQIYANANDLTQMFAPVEDISAEQLKAVFQAVYNDHPELFWLDTAYFCKYKRNGQCVEIDLRFNQTALDLEKSKAVFSENANSVLSGAGGLQNDYEKERYVHDALIEKISYNMGAQMNQSAYSGLVNGQTVCAGYARAYQYLLQQLGIPCYYCTGFAGENHAWNIVKLEDGYYNVDTTWDDTETESVSYDYFNKTDADYGATHVRRELSVYLPPCNGQTYREPDQPGVQKAQSGQSREEEIMETLPAEGRGELKDIEDIGISGEEVLHSLSDYYEDCYNRIVETGQGNYEFYNVVEGIELAQELYTAYQKETFREGYMDNAMTAISASVCGMNLEIEELAGDRYLVTHTVRLK